MATGQFPGKDPRASVALKDPRATASGRPVVVAPGPQKGAAPEPGSGARKAIAIGVVLLVLIVVANVVYAAINARKEVAEQIKAEDTTLSNNELALKVSQMQNTLTTMQNVINQQDNAIKQLRSELQNSRNSVDAVRSLYVQAQSTPQPKAPANDNRGATR